ncbi:hypothetical protein OE766_14915 [Pararhizobium sp. YC-54]|uniref:tetratricopeptide repeat protein n=1 Tax=Pararhizobium sp. YC-54 TaxID=2986920 RepID=UPI0021F6BAB9|nr:hypothetical protein [Pararhizobium sp. YC-54]MCV9999533.1 hypothetical protein [Pararhizobium sp. YC-54]
MKDFLHHVVSETLEGRADRIKSYSVGLEVFGRSDSFDPATDSVVRSTASRLRAALCAYYKDEGKSDPVTITIDRGSYVPEFKLLTSPAAEAVVQPNLKSDDEDPSRKTVPSKKDRLRAALFAIIPIICAVSLLSYTPSNVLIPKQAASAATIRRPCIVVPPAVATRYSPAAIDLVQALNDQLAVEMRAIGVATIMAAPDAEAANALAERCAAGDLAASVFRLTVTVRPEQAGLFMVWRLIDVQTEAVESSLAERIDAEVTPDRSVNVLASQILGTEGSLAVLLDRRYHNTLDPRECLSKAQRLEYLFDDVGRGKLRDCLEQIAQAAPNNPEAWALLSLVYARESRNEPSLGGDPAPFSAKALHAAREAERLSPDTFQTIKARMYLAYMDNRLPMYEAISSQLLERFGGAPNIKILIGSCDISLGRYDRGIALIKQGIAQKRSAGGFDFVMLAFAAYAQGNYLQALELADRVSLDEYYLVHVIKAAALGQLMRLDAAKRELHELDALRPNYSKYLYPDFRNRNIGETVIAAFDDGLRKAAGPITRPPP